jgi:hypothetical protein
VADENYGLGPQSGVAVEVNWNYNDAFKVQRDLCKLIDPKNGYIEGVYFAYGRCQDLLSAVQAGLGSAFSEFAEAEPSFLLPSGLHIIVAIRQRNRGLVVYSAFVNEPCTPSQLSWADSRYPGQEEFGEYSENSSNQQAELVGRHSRFAMLIKVPSKDTAVVVTALSRHIRKLPATLRRSLTWDRGLEMAKHQDFTIATDVQVYFSNTARPGRAALESTP